MNGAEDAWTFQASHAAVVCRSTVAPLPSDIVVTCAVLPSRALEAGPAVATLVTADGRPAPGQRTGSWPVHRLDAADAALLRSELGTIEELRALEPDSKCTPCPPECAQHWVLVVANAEDDVAIVPNSQGLCSVRSS